LACLLEYPDHRLAGRLRENLSPALKHFTTAISVLAPPQREELYTATFDVTPACVLNVSIHLFGEENFKRGEFMAGLQARYSQTGFSTMGELPDHLSVLLRFAAQTDETERRELVEFCLLGPVTGMIAAFNESNPYRTLLEAVRDTLRHAYPGMQPPPSPLEQMRSHGAGCATASPACACVPMRINDGPDDEAATGIIQPDPQLFTT